MVHSLVGRLYQCWLAHRSQCSLYSCDGCTQTLHLDVSLPNIILYGPKEGEKGVGYLIEWELGCELSKVVTR